ncbi:MAG: PAS domain-containing protein [Bacteroidales bacterium]|nr:PAS domain-containing protein [Bacteroidales bacterium]
MKNLKNKTKEQLIEEVKQLRNFKIYDSEKHHNLVETILCGIQEIDTSGIIVFANSAYHNMLGYENGELIGKSMYITQADKTGQKDLQDYMKKILQDQPIPKPWFSKLIKKDGGIINVQTDWNYKRNDEGEITGFVSVITNITKRVSAEQAGKQAELALRKSEERYRLLFNLLPYGGEVISKEGKIINCSQSTLRMLGYEMDELIGKHITNFVDADTVKLFKQNFPKLLSGKALRLEICMKHKNGMPINILRAAEPILNADGEVEAFLALNVDITERKKAEEALRRSEGQLHALIDAMPDFVCFKDGDGRWVKANDACIRIFQIKDIDYQGKKDSELAELNNKFRGAFLTCEESDARARKEGGLIHGEEAIADANGSVRFFDVIKVTIPQPGDERQGLVVIGHDITERKLAEEELKDKIFKLQQWHKLTVGREIKMIELKKEINELLKKAGQPPKYDVPPENEI